MGRSVTKNSQGELEVTETLQFSGANPTVNSVKLVAVDGTSPSDESPSWLGFTSQARSTAQGTELDIILQLDATGGLSTYTSYTFEIEGSDDQGATKTRVVEVNVGSLATSFGIENVMGQEDKYRQQGGLRVDNGGSARVVLTTKMPATVDMEIAENPSDEDNPTFTSTKSDVSSQETHHEFFFSVNPDSLYAFRVIAKADFDQSVSDQTSSIYYLLTGNELSYQSPDNFSVSIHNLSILSTTELVTNIDFSGLASSVVSSSVTNAIEDEMLSVTATTTVQSSLDVSMVDTGTFASNFQTLISSQVV